MSISCDKAIIFYPVTLTLEFDPIFKTLTLLITFEQRVLELWHFTWVFLVVRPFRGYHYFLPCDLDLDPFLKTNFWTVSARALKIGNLMPHLTFLKQIKYFKKTNQRSRPRADRTRSYEKKNQSYSSRLWRTSKPKKKVEGVIFTHQMDITGHHLD